MNSNANNASKVKALTTGLIKGADLKAGQVIKILGMHLYTVVSPPTKTGIGKAALIKGISSSLSSNFNLDYTTEYAVCEGTKQEVLAKLKPRPVITRGTISTANTIQREELEEGENDTNPPSAVPIPATLEPTGSAALLAAAKAKSSK